MPPLVLVAAAWVAGLFVAHHWFVPLGVEPLSLLLLGLIQAAAILLWPRDHQMRLVAACMIALLLAAVLAEYSHPFEKCD